MTAHASWVLGVVLSCAAHRRAEPEAVASATSPLPVGAPTADEPTFVSTAPGGTSDVSALFPVPPVPRLGPDREGNRQVVLQYLARLTAHLLTQEVRMPPLQLDERGALLYLPVASYAVAEGTDACLDQLGPRLGQVFGDPALFPSFPYTDDPAHPALPTYIRPSEVRNDRELAEQLLARSDEVRVVEGTHREAPPLAIVALTTNPDGTLRAELNVYALKHRPTPLLDDAELAELFRYENTTGAVVYRRHLLGGAWTVRTAEICGEGAPLVPVDVPAARLAGTGLPAWRQLEVEYTVLGARGRRTILPGDPTCLGEQIVPTLRSVEDGYLYVVQHGSDGTCNVIYPQPGQDNRVAAGRSFSILDAEGRPYVVTGTPGRDRTWFHVSRAPLASAQALLGDLAGGACDEDEVRVALGQQSGRYRNWTPQAEAAALPRVRLGGDGETVETIFPVVACDG